MVIIDKALELAANLVGLGKEWLGLQSKKLDLKNTAAMEQAKERQDEVKAQDTTNRAIAGKDADEVRRELSE
jgi:hypothetical protein